MDRSIYTKFSLLKKLRFVNQEFIPELSGPKFTHQLDDDCLFVFDQLICGLTEINNLVESDGYERFIITRCGNMLTAHTYTDDEGVILKLSGIQLLANNNKMD